MSANTPLKKRVSIAVLNAIAKAMEGRGSEDLIRLDNVSGYLVYFKDRDPNSDFFFGIKREEMSNNNTTIIYIAKKPASGSNINKLEMGVTIDQFANNFSTWLDALIHYSLPNILDDFILGSYQKEFYDEIEIIEEDANRAPFSYAEQLRLNCYLEDVIKNIDEFKTEKNKEQIEEIKLIAAGISEDITNETKNGIMKRLSLLWAKGRKTGIKVSGFLIKEFAKEFLKEGVKTIFETMKNPGKVTQLINLLNP